MNDVLMSEAAPMCRCLLDEQPSYLVPPRLLAGANNLSAEVVNPFAWFSWTGAPPPEIAATAAFMKGFDFGSGCVWVVNPGLRTVTPFGVGPFLRTVLAELRPAQTIPERVPHATRAVLTAADVFVARDWIERQVRTRAETAARATSQFEAGYTPLTGLIAPYHIGALRQYFRTLIRQGRLQLGDSQSPRRYAAHNEIVSRFFHRQLAAVVSDIVGQRVKPSYVYLASYLRGAELPRHTDREQCEFSLTLLVDYTPELEGSSPWPLHLDILGGKATVYQAIGDALLYRGRRLPHYRTPIPEGHTSTSLFFHYVAEDFTGSLD